MAVLTFGGWGDSSAGFGPRKAGRCPSGSACAEGLSSSVFSKALYMGVLQSVELEGPADGFWLLTWAVGFSETLQTYGTAPTFYNSFFSPALPNSVLGCVC